MDLRNILTGQNVLCPHWPSPAGQGKERIPPVRKLTTAIAAAAVAGAIAATSLVGALSVTWSVTW